MHSRHLLIGVLCSTFYVSAVPPAMAAAEDTGTIVFLDPDSAKCALSFPGPGAGTTVQYNLTTAGAAGPGNCKDFKVRSMQLVNFASAATILMTESPWCNTSAGNSDHWMRLKTIRNPTNIQAYEVEDLYTYQKGAIITPGLEMVDNYLKSGESGRDTVKCVQVAISSAPGGPKIPGADALPESHAWSADLRESWSFWECPVGQVMTGRRHKGDETGDTAYQCASLKQEGITLEIRDSTWHDTVCESGHETDCEFIETNVSTVVQAEQPPTVQGPTGIWFNCPSNEVMDGRLHRGDENGETAYRCGKVFSGTRQLIVTPDTSWQEQQKESKSEFTCAPGTVMVGRWHEGDENGYTRVRCATLR
ncbi:hypothetical protein [Pseudomonas sp. S32]|uniref:hypothetical protein n=1 Tax=Pseudomonas sp. S32 TaxID=2767448 RepID=UPI0019123175|nr:hypothetical protein [Pseudomonas sp. S32]MBK5008027.1 hypothetical protein [Pseudomonas sp. S32]